MAPMILNKPTATEEEFMLCKVCLKHFDPLERRPKQLPCSHIYCHRCIDNHMIKEKRNFKKVKCPICNRCAFYNDSSDIAVCQQSLDLVTSFKHLLKHNNSTRPCRDVHEDDMDAFGVEKSKRVVVKRSNPLLHPSNNWSQMDWSDDDNVDNDDNFFDSSRSSLIKDIKPSVQSSKNTTPSTLKSIWNQRPAVNKGDNVESFQNIPDLLDRHFSYLHDDDKNVVDSSTDHSLTPKSQIKSTNASANEQPTHQYFQTNLTKPPSESDDLDWNYFTQNLDTPKSTLTRDVTMNNFNDSADRRTQLQKLTQNFDSHLTLTTEIFQTGDLTFPSLIRSSQNGNLLIIIDQINQSEASFQILTIDGTLKKKFKVQGQINDACIVNNERPDDVIVATASKDGIILYNLSSEEKRKSIPIGQTKFIASYKKGFVAVNNDSLNFCQDLSCNIVLHSIKNVRANANMNVGSNTFRGILGIDTHNDLIGLLFSDQCLIIDQGGSLLQTIKLREAGGFEPKTNMQLSFNSNGNILAVFDKDKQLMEVHHWGLHAGSERSSVRKLSDLAPHLEGRFISGTMAGADKIVVIVQGEKRFGVYKCNIN